MSALKRAVAVFQVEVEMPANYDAGWTIGDAQAQIAREARAKLANALAKSELVIAAVRLSDVLLAIADVKDGKAVGQ